MAVAVDQSGHREFGVSGALLSILRKSEPALDAMPSNPRSNGARAVVHQPRHIQNPSRRSGGTVPANRRRHAGIDECEYFATRGRFAGSLASVKERPDMLVGGVDACRSLPVRD